MKRVISLALIIFFCFTFISCGSDSAAPDNIGTEKTVTVKTSAMSVPNSVYELGFKYKDGYFTESATVFNKDLALLSLGSSVATQSKSDVIGFFDDAEFKNVSAYGYNSPTSANSVAYVFGNKKIADFTLIAVAVRGFGYGREWAGNVVLGDKGDHYGFSVAADTVYSSLKNYLFEHVGIGKVKIWLCGYSRAGAIANVLAQKILTEKETGFERKNAFVYTFEAPQCLSVNVAQKFENVYNIVNSYDLVPNVMPETYGLTRCGIDIDISDPNVDKTVHDFDENVVFPKFTAKPREESDDGTDLSFADPKEFIAYLRSVIAKPQTNEDFNDVDVSTRKNYADNIQPTLSYLIDLFFNLKPQTKRAITDGVSQTSNAMRLFVKNGLFSFLDPIIAADGIAYDKTELAYHTELARKFISKDNYALVTIALSYSDNVKYTIYAHYTETTYALLSAYSFG